MFGLLGSPIFSSFVLTQIEVDPTDAHITRIGASSTSFLIDFFWRSLLKTKSLESMDVSTVLTEVGIV